MNITITLSAAEAKALGHVAVDPEAWIQNAVHERCRIAIDEIVAAEVERKLAANEPITGSKEEIVLAADIKSAQQIQTELLASLDNAG